jgi:acyl carrier protein
MTIEELRDLLQLATGKRYERLEAEQELMSLGLESIDRVRIVVRLEERIGKEIDEQRAMALKTVGDLLALAS